LASQPANTRFFVLALGLLVGFVISFVMLLSRLPVDSSLVDVRALEAPVTTENYEFYTVLPAEKAAAPIVAAAAPEPQQIIQPATRVVPGNAQSINGRSLAAESYAEIPASSLGQESYFLQAGNFREPGDAERARAAVLLLGLEAFIVTRQDASGATGHRVRVGPFFDQNRLVEAKQRLRGANIRYDIIRVTG
jgi:cell division protein FtsN